VYLHINWKAHAACELNFTVKVEELLKVTDSHVHWKSGNILETVLDRDVVTTGCQREVILIYGLCNSSNCDDLDCRYCRPIQVRYLVFVVRRAVPLHLQSSLYHWLER